MNKENIFKHQKLIEEYKKNIIEKIAKCPKESLANLELIYLYRKLETIKNAHPVGFKESDEEKRQIEIEKLNDAIKRRIEKYYLGQTINIKEIEEQERHDKNSAYNVLEKFKIEVKEITKKRGVKAATVLSTSGLEYIKSAKNRENQYYNELVNGIYSTTEFDGIYLYAIRAASTPHGMIIKNNTAHYPSNPFDENLNLKNKVSLYTMDINYFEPVVDFTFIDEKPIIKFDYEWIARYDKLKATEEQIKEIPRELFERYKIYVRESDEEILLNDN